MQTGHTPRKTSRKTLDRLLKSPDVRARYGQSLTLHEIRLVQAYRALPAAQQPSLARFLVESVRMTDQRLLAELQAIVGGAR